MGGDPAKGFVIGGISAGGNLAAVISHIYRDEKMSPPLTGIYLSVPMLVCPEAVPGKFKHQYLSREQNKTAPILNKKILYHHLRHHLSSPLDTKTCRRRISKFVAWTPCVTTASSMNAS